MALARPVDAIGPVEAGVEPLRRVRRDLLGRQHVADLVEEGASVVLGVEVAALPAPVGPGAGEAVEHVARIRLADRALRLGKHGDGFLVRHRAAKPGRDGGVVDGLAARRNTGLPEIFLGDDVGRDLAPGGGHHHVVEPEDRGPVRVADFGDRVAELQCLVGGLPVLRIAPFDPHRVVLHASPSSAGRCVGRGSAVNPPGLTSLWTARVLHSDPPLTHTPYMVARSEQATR